MKDSIEELQHAVIVYYKDGYLKVYEYCGENSIVKAHAAVYDLATESAEKILVVAIVRTITKV